MGIIQGCRPGGKVYFKKLVTPSTAWVLTIVWVQPRTVSAGHQLLPRPRLLSYPLPWDESPISGHLCIECVRSNVRVLFPILRCMVILPAQPGAGIYQNHMEYGNSLAGKIGLGTKSAHANEHINGQSISLTTSYCLRMGSRSVSVQSPASIFSIPVFHASMDFEDCKNLKVLEGEVERASGREPQCMDEADYTI